MARADYNTRQVPRDSGGSYTPPEEERPEGVEPRKFILKEKIGEMMKYGLPLANAFPRKDRKLADILRESMMELYRLAQERYTALIGADEWPDDIEQEVKKTNKFDDS